ncbi:Histone-lysine N-methyltransferase CLF [Vitis vinifera]|uniref:Histone-lysine N-methyltransferase CLF n=1 Tax=Vitis vinifera TaxID=29760 RepID=A0A438F5W8_VITVI|nr:Histone-lysine N-methyltransferase CLF [Vitis vinifera]
MTEDQSVVGRRRIYYDQTGGEALICSDSEEEAIEEEEEKKEFADFEDYILRLLPFAWVAVQGALIFNLEKLLSMAYICSDGYICREKALTTF